MTFSQIELLQARHCGRYTKMNKTWALLSRNLLSSLNQVSFSSILFMLSLLSVFHLCPDFKSPVFWFYMPPTHSSHLLFLKANWIFLLFKSLQWFPSSSGPMPDTVLKILFPLVLKTILSGCYLILLFINKKTKAQRSYAQRVHVHIAGRARTQNQLSYLQIYCFYLRLDLMFWFLNQFPLH